MWSRGLPLVEWVGSVMRPIGAITTTGVTSCWVRLVHTFGLRPGGKTAQYAFLSKDRIASA